MSEHTNSIQDVEYPKETDDNGNHCCSEGPADLRCTRINGHDGPHTTYRKVGGDDHHIEWWECNPIGEPMEEL